MHGSSAKWCPLPQAFLDSNDELDLDVPMRVKVDPDADELFQDLEGREPGLTMAVETDAYIDLTAVSPEKDLHNPISVVDAALNRLGTDDITEDRCPNR